MKFFIYKTLIISLFFFVIYHSTIGYTINSVKIQINNILDKDKITYFRNKVKKEIVNSLEKDRILSIEDAIMLKKFFKKLNQELNSLE